MPEVRDPYAARAGAIEERYEEYVHAELEIPEHLQGLHDELDGEPVTNIPGEATPTEPEPEPKPGPETIPGEATPVATPDPKPAEPVTADLPDETWTNAEIVAYAEANNIDLGVATKKADMLAVIEAAA